MEGHPIPQDITGFQFRLIGDMTIKQFAYVASGSILAWITYSLPILGIIKIPITAVFALGGAALAFLPISGRSMDVMAVNFIKALFFFFSIYLPAGSVVVPTSPLPTPLPQPAIAITQPALTTIAAPVVSSQMEQPAHAVPFIVSQSSGNPQPSSPIPTPEPIPQKEEEQLEEQEVVLEKQLEQAKSAETQAQNSPTFTDIHQKVLDLEKLLSETITQRQELERQIIELGQRLNAQNQTTFTPSVAEPKRETANARSIPSEMKKTTRVPIAPEFPNLLTGIIKDPRGNPLPNVLVEVKDKEGNPVRALKTNGLGQFSAATALSNGVYDISFEDPRGQGKFDTIEISATGAIIMPLEIISQDEREELRKSLFN